MLRSINFLCYSSVAGGAAGICGTIAHHDVITWVGVTTAIVSAVASTLIHIYHEIRQAQRMENILDDEQMRQVFAALSQLKAEIEFPPDDPPTPPTDQPGAGARPTPTARAYFIKLTAPRDGTSREAEHREAI